MGKTLGGGGGMGLSARFPVDADLSPFQKQVDEAVKNALVKFGILREQENGKFERLTKTAISKSDIATEKQKKKVIGVFEGLEKEMDKRMEKTTFSQKMMIRMMISEVNQTWNMVAQAAGWTKDRNYQMVMQTVQGIMGLVTTAYFAATTLAVIPVIGPFLAALSVGNAVAGMAIAGNMQSQAAAHDSYYDTLGKQILTYNNRD